MRINIYKYEENQDEDWGYFVDIENSIKYSETSYEENEKFLNSYKNSSINSIIKVSLTSFIIIVLIYLIFVVL